MATENPQSNYMEYSPPQAPDTSASAFVNSRVKGGIPDGMKMLMTRLFPTLTGFKDWQNNVNNQFQIDTKTYDTLYQNEQNTRLRKEAAGYNDFFSGGGINNAGGVSSEQMPLSYNSDSVLPQLGKAFSSVLGIVTGVKNIQNLAADIALKNANAALAGKKAEGQQLLNAGQELKNKLQDLYLGATPDFLKFRNLGLDLGNQLTQRHIWSANRDITSKSLSNQMNYWLVNGEGLPSMSPYAYGYNLGLQGEFLANRGSSLRNVGEDLRNKGLQLDNTAKYWLNKGYEFYNGDGYLSMVRNQMRIQTALSNLNGAQQAQYARVVNENIDLMLKQVQQGKLQWEADMKNLQYDLKHMGFTRVMDDIVQPTMDVVGTTVGAATSVMFGTSALMKAGSTVARSAVGPVESMTRYMPGPKGQAVPVYRNTYTYFDPYR